MATIRTCDHCTKEVREQTEGRSAGHHISRDNIGYRRVRIQMGDNLALNPSDKVEEKDLCHECARIFNEMTREFFTPKVVA